MAVLAGGTFLFLPSGERVAPHATLASCRPAHIEVVAEPEVVAEAEVVAEPEVAAEAEAPAPALSATELKLARYLSRRYLVGREASERVVGAAYDAADEVGLDPLVLLAVAAVESSFNPLAESETGARGLMQIVPKYHREKLRPLGGDEVLFDPEANILLGARILQEYVHRAGTLEAGLQSYNGAFFDASAQYARKVLAERARLEAVVHGARDDVREAAVSASAS